MKEIFSFKEPLYRFWNYNKLIMQNNVRAARYETETVSLLDPKIWNLLPIEYKDIESLH